MRIHKTTLKNGLRIITIPIKDTRAVTAHVIVEAGTKYETKKQNGISHFLEHVCFKGTLRRPKAFDINSQFDALGAQTNAFTSHEVTGYYAKVQAKHLPKILDLLSDMYLNSIFPEAEVEKEKGVIIEEINMYEDQPSRKVGKLFRALMYGDQGAGWPIIGEKETVKAMSSKDFHAYRAKHYVASATCIVLAGAVDHKQAVASVKELFSEIPTGRKHTKKRVRINREGPKVVLQKKATDQTHLLLGVPTFQAADKRTAALSVLNAVLSEGMSSRLHEKLREELGICYYVYSYVDEYTDHGHLVVGSGVDPKRSLEAIEAILGEFRRLRDQLVSDEELKRAKEYLAGSLYLGLETSDALASHYSSEEVLKRALRSPRELEKELRAVTALDIQKVAKTLFIEEALRLAMLGQVPTEKAVRAVLKMDS